VWWLSFCSVCLFASHRRQHAPAFFSAYMSRGGVFQLEGKVAVFAQPHAQFYGKSVQSTSGCA
jgi:hypothetical protein